MRDYWWNWFESRDSLPLSFVRCLKSFWMSPPNALSPLPNTVSYVALPPSLNYKVLSVPVSSAGERMADLLKYTGFYWQNVTGN